MVEVEQTESKIKFIVAESACQRQGSERGTEGRREGETGSPFRLSSDFIRSGAPPETRVKKTFSDGRAKKISHLQETARRGKKKTEHKDDISRAKSKPSLSPLPLLPQSSTKKTSRSSRSRSHSSSVHDGIRSFRKHNHRLRHRRKSRDGKPKKACQLSKGSRGLRRVSRLSLLDEGKIGCKSRRTS